METPRQMPVAMTLCVCSLAKVNAIIDDCFVPDAVLIEDDLLFKGAASIHRWHADFNLRYPDWRLAPVRVDRREGDVRVIAELRDQSAVTTKLRLRFTMREHRIARLLIRSRSNPAPRSRDFPEK